MTQVHLEVADAVAIITLDGRPTRNALDHRAALEVVRLCDVINNDPTIGAAVIRGEGTAFCSGADRGVLAEIAKQPASSANVLALSQIYEAFVKVGTLAVPTIAAIGGDVVGAGMNLALATDVRLMAEHAKWNSGFLRIGLHPGGGHFALLGRVVGRDAAAAIGLFGQSVDAERALQLGLAWAVVGAEQLDDRCLTMAKNVAMNPALARSAVLSMRTELGPPAMTWQGALEAERGRQMWSLLESPLNQQAGS
jgi:enoyl-CoA hydratase